MDNENINNSREQTEGILQTSETGTEDTPKIYTIEGIRLQIDENGNICVNAEDTARGLGITQIANSGNESVRWSRVKQYLQELGALPDGGMVDFITVEVFKRLAWRVGTEKARQFNDFLLETVISQLKSVAQATCSEAEAACEAAAVGVVPSSELQVAASSEFTLSGCEAVVTIVDGQPLTTSLAVAEAFESRHADVIRSIQRFQRSQMISNNDVSSDEEFLIESRMSSMFIPSTYTDANGRLRPMYLMTKDGFMMLSLQLMTRKALWFRLKFIDEFNRMQRLLSSGQYIRKTPSYEIDNPYQRAKRWMEEHEEFDALKIENQQLVEQVIEKDEKIELLTPGNDYANSISLIDDNIYTYGQSIKILNLGMSGKSLGRNIGMRELRAVNIIDRDNLPYQKYISSGYFVTWLETYYTSTGKEIVVKKSGVTQKGLQFFFRIFIKQGYIPMKDIKGKYWTIPEIQKLIDEHREEILQASDDI